MVTHQSNARVVTTELGSISELVADCCDLDGFHSDLALVQQRDHALHLDTITIIWRLGYPFWRAPSCARQMVLSAQLAKGDAVGLSNVQTSGAVIN